MVRVRNLSLQVILRDSRVQPREAINMTVVSEYAQAMAKAPIFKEAGLEVEPFPAVVVYHERDDDDLDYFWLADGWHRLLAAEEIGLKTFPSEIREGGMLDAIMHAAGANAGHGLRRTNRDKHRAVRMLLDHPTVIRDEWGNGLVAHAAGVSDLLVRTVRREREQELGLPPSHGRKGKDGKLYSLQLRTAQEPATGAQDDETAPQPPSGTQAAPEPATGDSGAFLYQCATAGCDAITTEESWHCDSCGAHLPVKDYPVGAECPICVDDPLAVPLDVLARVEDRELPARTNGSGTTQVPYTPGHLKPSSALLAYERLRAAVEIIDSLGGIDFRDIVEQAPDPDRFVAQVGGARTTLHVLIERYYEQEQRTKALAGFGR